jgi:hypothetical protein
MDTFKVIEKHLVGNKAVYCVGQAIKIIAAMNEMTPDEQSQSFLNKLTVLDGHLFRIENKVPSYDDTLACDECPALILIPNTSWVAVDVRDEVVENNVSVFREYSAMVESFDKRKIECTPETRLGVSVWESSLDGYCKNAIHCESPGYFTDDCLDEVQRFLDTWLGDNVCCLLLPHRGNRWAFYIWDMDEGVRHVVANGDYVVAESKSEFSADKLRVYNPNYFRQMYLSYPAESIHNNHQDKEE